MNLSQIAFAYRSVVFLALAILIVFGVYSYFTLPAQEGPSRWRRRSTASRSTCCRRWASCSPWSSSSWGCGPA